MTTTNEPILIDALLDQVPEDHEVVAFVLRMELVPGQGAEERRLEVGEITPANDRLAVEMCGKSVMGAMNLGAPTAPMVVWFVGGQQMRLKREPWRRLEHLFTMNALSASDFLAEIRPTTDDPLDHVAHAGDLDDFDPAQETADPT